MAGESILCGFIHDEFWEFSYNQPLGYLVYPPEFKSGRPANDQVPLKRTERRLEMICLKLTIPFAGNRCKIM